jgi:hypothetical protein
MKIEMSAKMISLVSALMLVTIFSERSLAQCAGSTTIFSENFGTGGDGTNCYSTVAAPAMSSSYTFIPGPTNGGNPPGDGQYAVWCNRVYGWFNWHNPFSDATADAAGVNGNMVVINAISGEFYRKTLTVCASSTYTVSFSLANLVDSDIGSCGAPFNPNITGSAYNVGTTTGTTTNFGTIAMTSTIVWNTYSFNFTTGAAQTSIDVVISNLNGGGCGNDFAFDDFSVSGPSSVLPVDLVSFSAKRIMLDATRLDWTTSEEINVSYFEIERSEDGINFDPIGKVQALGNTTGLHGYYFTDEEASSLSTVLYYRLNTIDLDGKSKYSEITKIVSGEYFFDVFPNPITQGETLVVRLFRPHGEDEVSISIINSLGGILYFIKGKNNEVKINTEELASGMYIIELSTMNERKFKKFIIE